MAKVIGSFLSALQACGLVFTLATRRSVSSVDLPAGDVRRLGCSNPVTQGLGNRPSSFEVIATVKVGEKVFSAKLHNWQPAREQLGYDLSDCHPVKGNSGGYKTKLDTGAFKSPEVECIYLLSYAFDQIVTGKITSSENAIKGGLLVALVDTLKATIQTVSIKDGSESAAVIFDQTMSTAIVQIARGRWQHVLSLPEKSNSTKGRASNMEI